MSFNEYSSVGKPPPIEVIFEKDLSSEEPPREEWSSLVFEIPEENQKRIKYAKGLYDPGSGEICTKVIPLSASSVLRHPYYNYPGILDPGIKQALLNPIPKILYPDDGQELYLSLCSEMGISKIRIFYKQLLEDTVDLKYYGISSLGFRAIAFALKLNRYVKVLNLTDNWISEDGCYHLGEMLVDNIAISEMNLTGCRIGPKGAKKLFYNLPLNRSLRTLNLSKNQLSDEGVEYLAKAIFKGADITNVNLSSNNLTAQSAMNLAEVFETNNKLTHLDLSWNTILSANAVFQLCQRLSENMSIQELNLSCNSLSGLRVGNAIKMLMKNPNIRRIYLTNNKLEGSAITAIGFNLPKAVKLEVLDLSYNPLTPNDAMSLLIRFRDRAVKLQRLVLENVMVSLDFIECMNEILRLKYRKNTVIIYGGIRATFVPIGVDIREIAMSRAESICKQSKKSPKDIAMIILELHKIDKQMGQKEFARAVRSRGANLDDDLIELLTNIFPGLRTEKIKNINLELVVDYIKRKWPDRKLPPTPPPELEPEGVVKGKKKKK